MEYLDLGMEPFFLYWIERGAIKKKLKDSSQLKEAEAEATTIESVSRTELFALPGSEKWKGAAKIREAWPVRKSWTISVLGGTGHCAMDGVKPQKDGQFFTPGVTLRKDLRAPHTTVSKCALRLCRPYFTKNLKRRWWRRRRARSTLKEHMRVN